MDMYTVIKPNGKALTTNLPERFDGLDGYTVIPPIKVGDTINFTHRDDLSEVMGTVVATGGEGVVKISTGHGVYGYCLADDALGSIEVSR